MEEAIRQAIEYGIEHDIMKEFLEQNGTEVANMLLSGWNMDEALIVSKEEGFEDGFEAGFAGGKAEGRAEGKAEGAARKQEELIRAFKDVLSPEVIAEKIHEPVQYVLDVLKDDGTMYACESVHPYENK